MIKHLAFLLTLCVFAINTDAQVKAGNKFYDRLAYKKAAACYERALKKDSSDMQVWSRLGDSYRLIRDSKNAERAYAHVVSGGNASANECIYYAQALMENEKYNEARKALESARAKSPGDVRSANLLSGLDKLSELASKSGAYDVKATNLNSKESDFSPVFYKEGVVFSSNRKYVEWVDNSHSWTGKQFYRLYYAKGSGTSFGKSFLFADNLQTKYHDGPVSFSKDGSMMAFTRNNVEGGQVRKDEQENIRLKIFTSVFSEDKWGIEVPFPFNSDSYSCAHPALSQDGKTLCFASDMPGGKGGMDIWQSSWNGTSWSSPINLEAINTPGNEVFPFLSGNGDLYFASDSHYGLGGFDIFISSPGGSGWSKPENIGAPVNSPDDDFGICFNESTKTGYFTSNRKDQGLNDDIYFFEKKCTNTDVTILDEQTQAPLANVTVIILENGAEAGTITTDESGKFNKCLNPSRNYEFKASRDKYNDATVKVSSSDLAAAASTGKSVELKLKQKPDNIANMSGRVYNADDKTGVAGQAVTLKNLTTGETLNATSDAAGAYSFPKLALDCEYELRTFKKDCGEPIETFNTKGVVGTKFITMDLALLCKGDVVRIDNIYYDYNKSDIRPDAAVELDKIVALLNKYPNMKIELRSHTDARGKDEYNMKLSDSRAKSAAAYIVSKGIDKARLNGKGYGESQLLNKCKNGVECDEKLHEENRRTEFKILSM